MRSKQVWRYWCDHCRKGGCQRAAMAKHERGCTLNPARECGMCKAGRRHGQPLATLCAVARNNAEELRSLDDTTPCATPDEVVARLFDYAEGCPACVFAALRQAGVRHNSVADRAEEGALIFDWRAEAVKFWRDVAEEDMRRDQEAYRY